jgi:hypothetical protein
VVVVVEKMKSDCRVEIMRPGLGGGGEEGGPGGGPVELLDAIFLS